MFDLRKKVRIEGLNVNRLIKNIQNLGVTIFLLDKISFDCIELQIRLQDWRKIRGLKDFSCFKTTDLGFAGRGAEILKRFSRIGVALGLVVVLIVSSIMFGKVWNISIDIEGENSSVAQEKTLQILAENGICVGSSISDFSLKELEDLILKNVENASIVVASREGCNLNVFLKLGVSPKLLREGHIIAGMSGLIEEVKLASGFLKVNVGDYVSEGQVLVESGTTGDIFLEAEAEIIARTWISGSASGLVRHTTLVRTGNCVKSSWLEVGKFRFLIEDDFVCPYQYFETELQKTEISQNNICPMVKVDEVFFELEPKEIVVSEQVLIEELKQKAYNEAKKNMKDGLEEISVSYSVLNEGEFFKVVCAIETLCDITLRENFEN